MRNTIGKEDSFFSMAFLQPMAVEMLIFVIHPNPFIVGKTFIVFNVYFKESLTYRYNDILNMFVLLRVIIMIKVLLLNSEWASNRAQRIW